MRLLVDEVLGSASSCGVSTKRSPAGFWLPNERCPTSGLDRLLDLKDNAHYGVLGVSKQEARSAMAQALRIVTAAKDTLAAP